MTTSNSASALKPTSSETTQAAPSIREMPHRETPTPPQQQLPDEPLVVIQPRRSWWALGLGEVWTYRELLYFLTWRDVKVRYKQTLLGTAWAILQPLCMMLIFTLFFGRLAGIPSDGVPYPLFAFAGLLPWTFFATAVGSGGNSIVTSANLVTKVYFPRLIVPGATVLAALVDFAIAFGVLAVLMVYYGVSLTWSALALPALVLMLTLLALGVATWMAALNVKYRDIKFALPFFIQLWFFASPIIYPVSLVPAGWRWALALNPMTGIIEGFRSALVGRPLPQQSLAVSGLITVALLVSALVMFKRMEKTFADIV